MNGVNCSGCCNSFLSFVTCGMLGSQDTSSDPLFSSIELMAVNTVSQVSNDPEPDRGLEERHVTLVPLGGDHGSLTNLFIIT